VFVEFSVLLDDQLNCVAEIVNGQPKPFPNEEWNRPGPAGSHFICVQSVVVDDKDNLWVLDPASPKMQGIVKGGPKLVKIDLRTDQPAQTIPFGEDIAPTKSYLNDVRIDTRSGMAFITDSGKGAIIVINLKNGNARRLLDGHTSTRPEKGFKLVVNGKELIDQQRKRHRKSHPMASRSMRRTAISIITHSPLTRFTASKQVFLPMNSSARKISNLKWKTLVRRRRLTECSKRLTAAAFT